MVARWLQWNRVCPSLSPSFFLSFYLSGDFLGIVSLVFSKFWDSARNYMQLSMTEPDFPEKHFCSQNWENGPKMGQKQSFLNFLKNLVTNFYWICSIMKIYIICCVPTQIPTIIYFSRTNQWNSLIFLDVDTNSHILKVDWKSFGWAWSRIGVANMPLDSKINCISRMNRWN